MTGGRDTTYSGPEATEQGQAAWTSSAASEARWASWVPASTVPAEEQAGLCSPEAEERPFAEVEAPLAAPDIQT